MQAQLPTYEPYFNLNRLPPEKLIEIVEMQARAAGIGFRNPDVFGPRGHELVTYMMEEFRVRNGQSGTVTILFFVPEAGDVVAQVRFSLEKSKSRRRIVDTSVGNGQLLRGEVVATARLLGFDDSIAKRINTFFDSLIG